MQQYERDTDFGLLSGFALSSMFSLQSEHHSKKKFSERFPHTCVTSMMESVVIENGLLVPFTLLPHILIQEVSQIFVSRLHTKNA